MFFDQIETGSFGELTPYPDSLHVLSWNINRGLQLDAIIEFLAKENADLILLQESDVNARRTAYRNVAREISAKLRMNYAFGIEFHELSQHHQSAAFHGQATLCRWPLLNSRLLRFSKQSRFWQPHWFIPNLPIFQRRAGGRMALVTCIQLGGKTLAVYNLHLESRGKDELRNSQIQELLADVDHYWDGMPVVIAGDFNFDVTDSFVWPSLNGSAIRNPFNANRARTTAPQSSARNGALDCILIKGPLTADPAKVHNTVCASDHFPLSVTLKLS
jgi:endonuclease/exonuclease/phosphatase family metal-dependent hydrolase